MAIVNTTIEEMTREQLIAEIETLEENCWNYRDVFDSLSDVVARTNKDGFIEMVSPSVYEVFGYFPEEILGKRAVKFYVDPEDRNRIIDLIATQGFCKHFEAQLYTKNDIIKVFSVNAKNYTNRQGNNLGVEIIFRDITQQKIAEEKLAKNAMLLSESQRLAHLGHWYWDLDKDTIEWSPELHRIYGIEESDVELTVSHCRELYYALLDPEGQEKLSVMMNEFLHGSSNQMHYEESIVRNNNETRFLETWATIVRDKDGNPVQIFGACLDITDKKITEKKLLESKEEFQNLFEFAPDARFIYKDDVIINVNSSFLNLYGYCSKDEIIGKSVSSELIVSNHTDPLGNMDISKTFANQKMEKVSHFKKDGSEITIEIHSSSILYKGSIHIQAISRDITERNRLEEENKRNILLLEESEKIAHLGHISWSSITNEVHWSNEIYRICGIDIDVQPSVEATMGIIHPDDLSYVSKNLNLTLKQLKKYKLEHRIVCANNGEIKWVQAELQLKFDSEGNIVNALGTILDITEKKKDQNALLQSEEEFRSIYENTPCGIPLVDMKGRILKANQRFIELIGYSEKELLKMNIRDISHPDELEDTIENFKALVSGEISHFELEKRYIKKSGEIMICHTAVTAPIGLNDQPEFLTASLTDITERKKIQEVLRGISEIQSAFIGEATPEIFFGKILQTVLNITNSKFGYIGEVHKKDGKPILTTHAKMAFSSEDLADITSKKSCMHSFDELTMKVMTSGRHVIYDNDDERNKSDSLCGDLENFMGLPFYSNNELVGIISVANKKFGYHDKDVHLLLPFLTTCSTLISAYKNEVIRSTELEATERMKEAFTNELETKVSERTSDLQRTQKELSISLENEKLLGDLKSRFVSTASHQFRTPLTVIQSNMGILSMHMDRMDDVLKPTFEKINHRIISQIGWMTAMMNDLLILGKIDLDSIIPEFDSINLVVLCEDIIENYNEIQKDQRRMTLTVTGSPKCLQLDANLITHAISNFVSNAFKYSVDQPAPIMRLLFNENSTQLSIIDFGLGIPKEDLMNLFEPFYRASNVSEVPGTGLGTTIAKEYIELNKGSIKVKSTINEGTEFILTF